MKIMKDFVICSLTLAAGYKIAQNIATAFSGIGTEFQRGEGITGY